jgi:hypothetical protein
VRHDDGPQPGQHFFDRPRNVKLVIWGLFTLCGLLVVVDLFVSVHGVFAWERATGFYAAYGFVACVLLVLVAKHVLRPFAKRDEDYYE